MLCSKIYLKQPSCGFILLIALNGCFRSVLVLIIPLLLSSCAIYAPDHRTTLNRNLPKRFSIDSTKGPNIEEKWWKSFQSLELNGLIAEALTNSPSIQQAWARLAYADAIAAKVNAMRYPDVSYQATASDTRNRAKTTIKSYFTGLVAAYELDLWGRIQSETEAVALDREASQEQLNTVAVTLSAQVAKNWTGIIAQRLQTELFRKQLEANQTLLELIELRFRKSFATALDVYQQRQTVTDAKARIPLSELREQLLVNQLAALLGRDDFQSLVLSSKKLPTVGTLPSIGIPSDVLACRPDVRRAWLRLRSADWTVSVARADRLPAVRLSAASSYTSPKSSELFDDWFSNLVGEVTGPLLEGGRRRAEVARTRAVVDERLADYREIVLNAIREIEDALISEQKQCNYIVALDQNLELNQNAYREAFTRYQNGLIEYPPVLVEFLGLQTLEHDCVKAQYDLIQYRIDLYWALGGRGFQ